MNKVLKSTLGVAAAAVIAGVAVAPAVVAWGDNLGGRQTYSLDQINKEKATEGKVVFNSIVDDGTGYLEGDNIMPLKDERNFVGARIDDGTDVKNNAWYGTEITVEEGKTYLIRLYAHNNGIGEGSTATGVNVSFDLPKVVDTEERVSGFINVGNPSEGTPSRYWDSVVFKSADGRPFYLDYIEGSAILANNGFAAGGQGVALSDTVVTNSAMIGYNGFDGVIPGCYQYAEYVGIKVKPVFESSSIEKKVRLEGTTEWKDEIDAKIGDKVEYQIHYKNLNATRVEDVIVQDFLPAGMKYVEGTTQLFSTNYPNGAHTDDNTLVTDGVNVGNVAVDGDVYVRFTAEVVDEEIVCGVNRLVNQAKATANGFAVVNHADVYVNKTEGCSETPTPTPGTTTTTTTTSTPTALPSTGPEAAVSAVLGAGSLTTAAGYYLASRKQLRK